MLSFGDRSQDSHVLLSMIIVAKIQRKFKSIEGKRICVIRGIETIPCPICGERLYHYDSRKRSVRTDEEKYYHFLLRRLRCIGCMKLHLELLGFLLPSSVGLSQLLSGQLAGSQFRLSRILVHPIAGKDGGELGRIILKMLSHHWSIANLLTAFYWIARSSIWSAPSSTTNFGHST